MVIPPAPKHIPAEDRKYQRFVIAAGLTFSILPILPAFVVGFFTDFGSHVHQRYFEVLAEGILPVLLIGAVVEWALLVDKQMEFDSSAASRFEARAGALSYGLMFVAGEGMALYAIASQTETTFLVLATGLIAVELALDLVINIGLRTSGAIREFTPKEMIARSRDRQSKLLRRRVELLEKEAENARRKMADLESDP